MKPYPRGRRYADNRQKTCRDDAKEAAFPSGGVQRMAAGCFSYARRSRKKSEKNPFTVDVSGSRVYTVYSLYVQYIRV